MGSIYTDFTLSLFPISIPLVSNMLFRQSIKMFSSKIVDGFSKTNNFDNITY